MSRQVDNNHVYIVLAAHNGERFLAEQLQSIREQSFENWRLLISDDASTDRSKQLVHGAAENDSRIAVLDRNETKPFGVTANFSILLEAALREGAHVCFIADQDDIWAPRKLEMQLGRFPQAGLERDSRLVHSDLRLVNERGELVHGSFFGYRGLEPMPELPLNQLLSLNFVTGCSVSVNRRLLELATPIPDKVIMHDWWLALVAAADGVIDYIEEPLVDYRQHGENVVGAAGEAHLIGRISQWRANWVKGSGEFRATFTQVSQLLQRLSGQDTSISEAERILQDYLRLPNLGARDRFRTAHLLRLRQGKSLLRLVFYLRLIFAGRRRTA